MNIKIEPRLLAALLVMPMGIGQGMALSGPSNTPARAANNTVCAERLPVASGVSEGVQTSRVALSASGGTGTGAALMLTATVRGERSLPASGMVYFRAGNVLLGSAPVDAEGVASVAVTAKYLPGNYNISADYLGSTDTVGSTINRTFTLGQ